MVSTVDMITAPTASGEVKEVIMGMKNNQAAGRDLLQGESFIYGGNEIKNMKEIVNKV